MTNVSTGLLEVINVINCLGQLEEYSGGTIPEAAVSCRYIGIELIELASTDSVCFRPTLDMFVV
jgi:hypothetical protein